MLVVVPAPGRLFVPNGAERQSLYERSMLQSLYERSMLLDLSVTPVLDWCWCRTVVIVRLVYWRTDGKVRTTGTQSVGQLWIINDKTPVSRPCDCMPASSGQSGHIGQLWEHLGICTVGTRPVSVRGCTSGIPAPHPAHCRPMYPCCTVQTGTFTGGYGQTRDGCTGSTDWTD